KLTISELWQRIEAWLSANAPKIIGNLNPPATDAEVAAAEAALGCQMPDQWRQLYQVHNGMNSEANLGSLFYGMEFWSLAEVVREHGNSQDFAAMPYKVEAADPGIRLENMYRKEWIALSFDGEETLLRIDLDPGPGGNLGQIIFTDHEYNI